MNNPFDVKENDERALTSLFTCHLISVWVSLDFPCTARGYFSKRLSNDCQVSISLLPRFAQI
jgi:hypothetical protein